MASIPPIPPLLCNTPPPIDFGEEDDSGFSGATLVLGGDEEFGDFALASETLNCATSDDVSSLPPSPQQTESFACEYINSPPDLETHEHPPGDRFSPLTVNADENRHEKRPAEACNFHVSINSQVNYNGTTSCPTPIDESNCGEEELDKSSTNLSTTKVENPTETPPSTPTPQSLVLGDADNADEFDKSANLCKSSNLDVTTTAGVNQLVLLEDLVDDSSDDERHCSPKIYKDSSRIVDGNMDDFFTISRVDESECHDIPSKSVVVPQMENFSEVKCVADDSTGSASAADTKSVSSGESNDSAEFANFNADFGQFTDLPTQSFSEAVEASTLPKRADVDNPNFDTANDDDDFDEFQDFTVGSDPTITPVFKTSPICKTGDVQPQGTQASQTSKAAAAAQSESDEEQDSDGFGDFAEAAFPEVTASDSHALNTTAPTSANSAFSDNISERLKPLLEMMFPLKLKATGDEEGSTKLSHNRALQLASVDMAKALEYQWINSEMRHALIRSLGIDSRNILFGEKWNSSMPRFAANLSFNPLKPLKTQSTNNIVSPAEENVRSSTRTTNADVNIVKNDVPAVEFDWQSSGLVNPLDGSKEAKGAREAEAVYTSEPGELHASNSQQQSHTSDAYDDDQFPETLNTNGDVALTVDDVATKSVTDDGEIGQAIEANTTLHLSEESNENFGGDSTMTSLEVEANVREAVATSTYAGPLKETHIYTPSMDETVFVKTKLTTAPIDFDYEIAATGIVINETVVKKEYRDVEYNPGFRLESSNKMCLGDIAVTSTAEFPENSKEPATSINELSVECCDDFTEFQSVPPQLPDCTQHESSGSHLIPVPATKSSLNLTQPANLAMPTVPPAVTKTIEMNTHTRSRTSSPTITENMILSPAILLPQAISLDNAASSKRSPKIEWGDTTASINPEELARIEELFPQPKVPTTVKRKETNNSQSSTPTHMMSEQKAQPFSQPNFLSISASVAKQEQDAIQDDDYWSDFVSVPVKAVSKRPDPMRNNNNTNIMHTAQFKATISNANAIPKSYRPVNHPRQSDTAISLPDHKSTSALSVGIDNAHTSNDDEWSEFVSGTPSLAPTSLTTGSTTATPASSNFGSTPQFNSAAWQNANFYNNPLSFYQRNQSNATSPPQQIHIMQDFSAAPPIRPHIQNPLSNSFSYATNAHTNQFQVGGAKVAPSISLIPDLGFVAPATSAHTAFVNVLPHPSFNNKK